MLRYERELKIGDWHHPTGDAQTQLRIVGVETWGMVIVARIEGKLCFLDAYDVNHGTKKKTLVSQGRCTDGKLRDMVAWDVAEASVTPDLSLVAITVKNFHPSEKHSSSRPQKYESFLIPAHHEPTKEASLTERRGKERRSQSSASYYQLKKPTRREEDGQEREAHGGGGPAGAVPEQKPTVSPSLIALLKPALPVVVFTSHASTIQAASLSPPAPPGGAEKKRSTFFGMGKRQDPPSPATGFEPAPQQRKVSAGAATVCHKHLFLFAVNQQLIDLYSTESVEERVFQIKRKKSASQSLQNGTSLTGEIKLKEFAVKSSMKTQPVLLREITGAHHWYSYRSLLSTLYVVTDVRNGSGAPLYSGSSGGGVASGNRHSFSSAVSSDDDLLTLPFASTVHQQRSHRASRRHTRNTTRASTRDRGSFSGIPGSAPGSPQNRGRAGYSYVLSAYSVESDAGERSGAFTKSMAKLRQVIVTAHSGVNPHTPHTQQNIQILERKADDCVQRQHDDGNLVGKVELTMQHKLPSFLAERVHDSILRYAAASEQLMHAAVAMQSKAHKEQTSSSSLHPPSAQQGNLWDVVQEFETTRRKSDYFGAAVDMVPLYTGKPSAVPNATRRLLFVQQFISTHSNVCLNRTDHETASYSVTSNTTLFLDFYCIYSKTTFSLRIPQKAQESKFEKRRAFVKHLREGLIYVYSPGFCSIIVDLGRYKGVNCPVTVFEVEESGEGERMPAIEAYYRTEDGEGGEARVVTSRSAELRASYFKFLPKPPAFCRVNLSTLKGVTTVDTAQMMTSSTSSASTSSFPQNGGKPPPRRVADPHLNEIFGGFEASQTFSKRQTLPKRSESSQRISIRSGSPPRESSSFAAQVQQMYHHTSEPSAGSIVLTKELQQSLLRAQHARVYPSHVATVVGDLLVDAKSCDLFSLNLVTDGLIRWAVQQPQDSGDNNSDEKMLARVVHMLISHGGEEVAPQTAPEVCEVSAHCMQLISRLLLSTVPQRVTPSVIKEIVLGLSHYRVRERLRGMLVAAGKGELNREQTGQQAVEEVYGFRAGSPATTYLDSTAPSTCATPHFTFNGVPGRSEASVSMSTAYDGREPSMAPTVSSMGGTVFSQAVDHSDIGKGTASAVVQQLRRTQSAQSGAVATPRPRIVTASSFGSLPDATSESDARSVRTIKPSATGRKPLSQSALFFLYEMSGKLVPHSLLDAVTMESWDSMVPWPRLGEKSKEKEEEKKEEPQGSSWAEWTASLRMTNEKEKEETRTATSPLHASANSSIGHSRESFSSSVPNNAAKPAQRLHTHSNQHESITVVDRRRTLIHSFSNSSNVSTGSPLTPLEKAPGGAPLDEENEGGLLPGTYYSVDPFTGTQMSAGASEVYLNRQSQNVASNLFVPSSVAEGRISVTAELFSFFEGEAANGSVTAADTPEARAALLKDLCHRVGGVYDFGTLTEVAVRLEDGEQEVWGQSMREHRATYSGVQTLGERSLTVHLVNQLSAEKSPRSKERRQKAAQPAPGPPPPTPANPSQNSQPVSFTSQLAAAYANGNNGSSENLLNGTASHGSSPTDSPLATALDPKDAKKRGASSPLMSQQRAAVLSVQYSQAITDVVNDVFVAVNSTLQRDSARNADTADLEFSSLRALAIAVEDLGLPHIAGFAEAFACSAYTCLSLASFFSLFQRGGVVLSDRLALYVVERESLLLVKGTGNTRRKRWSRGHKTAEHCQKKGLQYLLHFAMCVGADGMRVRMLNIIQWCERTLAAKNVPTSTTQPRSNAVPFLRTAQSSDTLDSGFDGGDYGTLRTHQGTSWESSFLGSVQQQARKMRYESSTTASPAPSEPTSPLREETSTPPRDAHQEARLAAANSSTLPMHPSQHNARSDAPDGEMALAIESFVLQSCAKEVYDRGLWGRGCASAASRYKKSVMLMSEEPEANAVHRDPSAVPISESPSPRRKGPLNDEVREGSGVFSISASPDVDEEGMLAIKSSGFVPLELLRGRYG